MATVGAVVLTSVTAASSVISDEPTPSPTSATASGSPAATTEPKAKHQDDQRDDDADQLGGAARRREVLRHLAAELDLHAGGLQRLGRGRPQGVDALGAVEVGDRDVVLHGDQRGVAVGRHPRRRRRTVTCGSAAAGSPTGRPGSARSSGPSSACTTTRASGTERAVEVLGAGSRRRPGPVSRPRGSRPGCTADRHRQADGDRQSTTSQAAMVRHGWAAVDAAEAVQQGAHVNPPGQADSLAARSSCALGALGDRLAVHQRRCRSGRCGPVVGRFRDVDDSEHGAATVPCAAGLSREGVDSRAPRLLDPAVVAALQRQRERHGVVLAGVAPVGPSSSARSPSTVSTGPTAYEPVPAPPICPGRAAARGTASAASAGSPRSRRSSRAGSAAGSGRSRGARVVIAPVISRASSSRPCAIEREGEQVRHHVRSRCRRPARRPPVRHPGPG